MSGTAEPIRESRLLLWDAADIVATYKKRSTSFAERLAMSNPVSPLDGANG